MSQRIDQLKFDTAEENSLSISQIQTGSYNSVYFRSLLVSKKYKSFDGKTLKGDLCYDAYYKEFEDKKGLKYIIYCYCYDLKELVEEPASFEFSFEVQIETERGIIGLEAIQWDFRSAEAAKENLEYFELKIDMIWTLLGSKLFPS